MPVGDALSDALGNGFGHKDLLLKILWGEQTLADTKE